MTAALKMRDLAHRLLRYEADIGNAPGPAEPAILCVYEKLRSSLVEVVGIAGFQSLASRALILARPDAPGLAEVQIASDGSLLGLGQQSGESLGEHQDQEGGRSKDLAGEVAILLIARMLELLRLFLGEALTLSLLRNAWPGEVLEDDNAVDGRTA
jgi:hypothetical protein